MIAKQLKMLNHYLFQNFPHGKAKKPEPVLKYGNIEQNKEKQKLDYINPVHQ